MQAGVRGEWIQWEKKLQQKKSVISSPQQFFYKRGLGDDIGQKSFAISIT